MAAQGEQGLGGICFDVESMAQDESTAMQGELSPQINAESEMGAVAGAADERPPRANPPTDRMMEMLMRMMQEMKNEINTNDINGNLDAMRGDMDANTQTLQGETQSMGLNLQAGQEALKKELEEAKGKMAKDIGTIREEVNELKGSVKGV